MATMVLIQEIRQSITYDHGLSLSAIYLIWPRTIPKTTSGKVARSWCRRALLADRLDVVLSWLAPPDEDDGDDEGLTDGEEIMSPISPSSSSTPDSSPLSPEMVMGVIEVDTLTINEIVHIIKAELAKILKVSTRRLSSSQR